MFSDEYNPTVLVDFKTWKKEYKYTYVTMNFFDFSGYDEFRTQRGKLYSEGQAALIVYSCTSEKSLTEATMWCKEARDNLGDNAILILVENKVNLMRLF